MIKSNTTKIKLHLVCKHFQYKFVFIRLFSDLTSVKYSLWISCFDFQLNVER
jgi:hypothetical protein